MNKSIYALGLITTALAAGCASAPDDGGAVGETDQEMISLNGTSLNGTALSGTSTLGGSLAGQSLISVGTTGTSSTGTTLTATSTTAPPLSTATVVGSTWTGTASNNASVKLRIDRATLVASELWSYAVSYQTTTGWSPLCGLDGSSQPITAVPVAGSWGPVTDDLTSYTGGTTKFTWACRAKTIAKCVELGYKTYKGWTNQLQSCVRMLRGDYCGSGNANTVDGTTINLYDNVGVQADNQAWPAEAEWTPSGARCINSNNAGRWQLVQAKEPKCVKPLLTATCGASFSSGAVLIDEYQN